MFSSDAMKVFGSFSYKSHMYVMNIVIIEFAIVYRVHIHIYLF